METRSDDGGDDIVLIMKRLIEKARNRREMADIEMQELERALARILDLDMSDPEYVQARQKRERGALRNSRNRIENFEVRKDIYGIEGPAKKNEQLAAYTRTNIPLLLRRKQLGHTGPVRRGEDLEIYRVNDEGEEE